MGKTLTYVFQTATKAELAYRDLLLRLDARGLVDECFVPARELRKKFGGVWRTETQPLFPGYVFVRCGDIQAFVDCCVTALHHPKVLGYEGGYSELTEREAALLDAIAGKGNDRVAKLSEGVIEGGEIRILQGPLMGRQGLIRRIDRHKRLAWVELPIMGRPVTVTLGLAIVVKT